MKKSCKSTRGKLPQNPSGQEENFRNNPFALLNPGAFPSSKSGNVTHVTSDRDTERDLFLRAVNSPDLGLPEKKPFGFTISEQCLLPEIKKRKKIASDKPVAPAQSRLDETEKNEFMLAMRNATPLRGKGRQVAPGPKTLASPPAVDPDFAELLGEKLEFALLWSDEYLEGRVSDLDELLMNRLREGQMSPEAHLDLHGLNAPQAFEELKFFIRSSWYKGLRVVLVVTGRGRNSPAGQSVLRHKIQTWLVQEPFKRVVLAFCTALPQDGGPGSVYVLLRRFRKKGRISWNRLAPDAELYD